MPTLTRVISFCLNGRELTVVADPGRSLLRVLRDDLGLTGTKQGCDSQGECGACTVLLDGEAVRSCLTPVGKVAGREVTTVEGLAQGGRLHPLQQVFVDCGAVQCGYCTPGMLMAGVALLNRTSHPTRQEILEALDGNLCRCTGYRTIVGAVEAAAAMLRGEAVPVRAEREVIGGSQVRVDAVDKVTGAARYAEDIQMPGLLHAVLVRSPLPHAVVEGIDPGPALEMPGVVRVLTAADIPGVNSLEGYSQDEPLLTPAGHTVRMVGAAVALVVAESAEAARAGAAAVRVDYRPLAAVYDPVEAMQPGAVHLYPGGNVLSSCELHFGDLETALAGAEVVETAYQTSFLEHVALERETVLSYSDAQGRVVVVAGHQEPHWAQGWIARALGQPAERVRVITPPVGGAFGGKQDPWPLMAGALAAYHVRRPVRLTYSRRESFDASPKRHPYTMAFRIGARHDGALTGLQMRIVANTGAYDCDGRYIPNYAIVAGGGPYRWEAVEASAWAVYTNGPKAGQMRGFGTPQSTLGRECSLDELAARLGLDPLEFRLRNAIDDDTITFLGYPPAETMGYRQCLEAIRPHYQAALAAAEQANRSRAGGPWRRGVGLAGMWYRFGKSGRLESEARAELGCDGRITLFFAAPDYGQGTATVMAQLAAEVLGLPVERLRLVNADTALTPDSGIQGASRSTYWVGGAVVQAARVLRERILRTAAEMLDCPPDRLALTAEAVRAPGGGPVSLGEVAAEMDRTGLPRQAAGVFAPAVGPDLRGEGRPEYLPFFVTGVHLAEVEVHLETGEVEVQRVVAAHDVGRAINPEGARGQIEGAILMGLGSALMEEYLPEVTTGLADYYLPTMRCAPQIEVILVEVPSRWGPYGAKGLGESATLATAPALLNAIAHASGGRVRQIPATPERVLAAIRQAGA
jgi:aldehyde oxidoreductase